MRLRAIGGLCNRLQAILSYRAVFGELDVMWTPSVEVSMAPWAAVFQPVAGVRISAGGPWDKEDWSVHTNAPADWAAAYRELLPTDDIAERIGQLRLGLGPHYNAVHIRRTDWTHNVDAHGGNVRSNEEYRSWAAERSSLPLYLATDNGETQCWWRAHYGGSLTMGVRLEGREAQSKDDRARNGRLADAVVDLFVCAAADDFMGSEGSSFTDTVRRLKACWQR